MKTWLILGWLVLGWANGFAQSFELLDKQDSYQGGISQTLRIPLRIKNNTDKSQFYVFRVQGDLNTTQKGYFCLDKNCLEPGMEEFSKKVEPGETLQNLYFMIETGLLSGQHTIRFEIFPKGSLHLSIEHPVMVTIDERNGRTLVFHSKDITIHEVYPNPVTDVATIDYTVHNDFIKAKVVIHNILGKALGDYELPILDNKLKIQTEELPAGVYFYTLYLNSEGVFTRKLIVRK
jgi:Secretion system C-terminal sorting domain